MTSPLVSIVLPTRNGAETLPALLDAVAAQRVDFTFEIVAVDSGSNDGSAEMLRARADRFVAIPASTFDHGATRNLGVEQARGELVVLMVQDAVPASERWLTALTAPLRDDARIAGAFARQLPNPSAGALTRHYLATWAAASAIPRVASIPDAAAFHARSPREQFEVCAFDNVCSCIRRSVWREHPFKPTPIAEDVEWARDVLLAGHRLAYAPDAVVFHSHDRGVRYELARTYVLHRRLYELFGLRTIPTLPLLARATASSLVTHLRFQRDLRAVGLALAWPLGQYSGALSAVRGWRAARVDGV